MTAHIQLIQHYTLKNLIILFISLYTLTGCGGTANSGGDPSGNSGGGITDTTSPNITLIGAKEIIINKAETYVDPGVTALDNVDGDISDNITKTSNLDNTKPGTYTIIYSVYDKAGNLDSKTRTVNVIDVFTPAPRAGLTINEVLVANTYSNLDPSTNQFSGWIELFNNTNSPISLNNHSLSDGTTTWSFPNSTIAARAYLIVWMDGTGTGLHASFQLDIDGESITLSDAGGEIDTITFGKQKSNISFTKQGDILYYMSPTMGSANTEASSLLLRAKKPDFSLTESRYTSAQTLILTHENSGDIHYTTDGSIPTKNSTKYTAPITINSNAVIRAVALEKNKFISSIKNRSYFINENASLPIMSLTINDDYLNNPSTGIYYTDQAKAATDRTQNYYQDWVRSASLEYIKDGKSQFSENIGVRIHGQGSRANPKKSFNIYAKDKFGPSSIDYPLFADKNIKKFKSIVLKNGGVDQAHHSSMLNNPLIHYIVKDNMDIDYVSYQPCIMFINGQYWGVYNIREKDNEDYIEANHGIDSSLVEYLRINGTVTGRLTNPRSAAYEALIANVNDFNYLSSHMDIDEYINYMITQIFDANTDWPSNNTTAWSELSNTGKFRWTLNDTDNGFMGVTYDSLANLLDANSNTNIDRSWSTLLFRTLLQNSDFRQKFISRFTTHLNTTFETSRIRNIMTPMIDTVAPEMNRDFLRWDSIPDTTSWNDFVRFLNSFANNRTANMRSDLQLNLGLTGNNLLTIPLSNNGYVTIDGAKITQAYSSPYFNNAKVTLQAIPAVGYTFEKWSIDGVDSFQQTLEFEFSTAKTVQAIFKPFNAPAIVINEINFKSQNSFDTKDWIELYNHTGSDLDISGWTIQDSFDSAAFTIPTGTILQANHYLILSKNKTKFLEFFPDVSPVIDGLSFGISSKGDTIQLFNTEHALVDTVTFDSSWIADYQKGNTLSLDNPSDDNTLAENWHVSGEAHGSPGREN